MIPWTSRVNSLNNLKFFRTILLLLPLLISSLIWSALGRHNQDQSGAYWKIELFRKILNENLNMYTFSLRNVFSVASVVANDTASSASFIWSFRHAQKSSDLLWKSRLFHYMGKNLRAWSTTAFLKCFLRSSPFRSSSSAFVNLF